MERGVVGVVLWFNMEIMDYGFVATPVPPGEGERLLRKFYEVREVREVLYLGFVCFFCFIYGFFMFCWCLLVFVGLAVVYLIVGSIEVKRIKKEQVLYKKEFPLWL